jgi:hypothetical protein
MEKDNRRKGVERKEKAEKSKRKCLVTERRQRTKAHKDHDGNVT